MENYFKMKKLLFLAIFFVSLSVEAQQVTFKGYEKVNYVDGSRTKIKESSVVRISQDTFFWNGVAYPTIKKEDNIIFKELTSSNNWRLTIWKEENQLVISNKLETYTFF